MPVVFDVTCKINCFFFAYIAALFTAIYFEIYLRNGMDVSLDAITHLEHRILERIISPMP